MRRHPPPQSNSTIAFTLIEVLVSTVLVGLLITSALQSLTAAARLRNQRVDAIRGKILALELMNEVIAKPFEDPTQTTWTLTTESGEGDTNRLDFDDIDDYNRWVNEPPQAPDGSTAAYGSNHVGWQLEVAVVYCGSDGVLRFFPTDYKRIVVRATSPANADYELHAIRTRSGDRPGMNNGGTYVKRVDVVLETVGSSGPLRMSVPIPAPAEITGP